MKKYLHPKYLPILIPVASLLGFVLRLWTMGSGPDQEGLYEPQPFAWALLWIVTGLTLAAIVLLSARLKNPGRYADNFPPSIVGAAGNAFAALVIMMAGLGILTTAKDWLSSLTGILGVISAVGLVMAAFARYKGEKSSFLLHAIPCLFFALRIFERCKAWSNIPQITFFLFPFAASVCAMLASYQLACFDVNLGKRRSSLFWSLSTVYFCMLSLPNWEEPLFYIGIAVWLLTNLCSVRPMKARKPPQAEPAPEAVQETTPAAEPAAQEELSLDELKDWLDQE